MNFAGVSLFSIVLSALRPGAYSRCWAVPLSLAAAVVAVRMVEIGWSAVLGLVAAAILYCHSRGRCQRFAGAGGDTSTTTNSKVGRPHASLPRRLRTTLMDDRFQARNPLPKEAQLMRARILWHFYGDRHGTRGHCLDLLGKMRPEDPLFTETCNLYLNTCRTAPSKPVPPVVPLPAVRRPSMRPIPVTVGGAKIIPFKSPDVRASSRL